MFKSVSLPWLEAFKCLNQQSSGNMTWHDVTDGQTDTAFYSLGFLTLYIRKHGPIFDFLQKKTKPHSWPFRKQNIATFLTFQKAKHSLNKFRFFKFKIADDNFIISEICNLSVSNNNPKPGYKGTENQFTGQIYTWNVQKVDHTDRQYEW